MIEPDARTDAIRALITKAWQFDAEIHAFIREADALLTAQPAEGWQPIATCPESGLFLVYEDGAMRMMYRSRGEWESTAVALDSWGAPTVDIKVRETGVYNPTHWMPLPDPPKEPRP